MNDFSSLNGGATAPFAIKALNSDDWKAIHPTAWNVQHDSLAKEGSGRTNDAVMHISWIASDMLKFSITLDVYTQDALAVIRGITQGKAYYIRCPADAKEDDHTASGLPVFERLVYTSNSKSDFMLLKYNGMWKVSFNGIEVAPNTANNAPDIGGGVYNEV